MSPRRCLACLALVCSLASASRADEGDDSLTRQVRRQWAVSVGVGLGTALATTTAGSMLLATADQSDADYVKKRAGFHLMADGLMLAPVLSHLVVREWGRAAIFGGINLAAAAIAIGLLESTDSLLDDGTAATRVTFGAALAVEVLVAAVGLIDSLAGEDRLLRRARQRSAPRTLIWPNLAPTTHGRGAIFSLAGVM